MKSNYILSLAVFVVIAVSCKQEAANVQQETVQDTTKMTVAQEPSTQTDARAQAAQATQASSGGHDYTFLTDKLFHYKGSFGGNKGGEPLYKNEWIDLAPDGTYKAGKLKEQTHTGKWSYNHEAKIIQLIPDVRTFKMSEWQVMYNDQMMVWVGTQTYGNNNIQVQLVRSDVLP
jgi:hypothetical protein